MKNPSGLKNTNLRLQAQRTPRAPNRPVVLSPVVVVSTMTILSATRGRGGEPRALETDADARVL